MWFRKYCYVTHGRRQDFGSGGMNIGQNFIHEFHSSPVLQNFVNILAHEEQYSEVTHQIC